MACPNCGCKVTYQFDDSDEEHGMADDRLERCAACGAVFDIDEHTPEDDDEGVRCKACFGRAYTTTKGEEMDRNVSAAARHHDDEESSNERACHAAASKVGVAPDQANQCEDGAVGCPECPWRPKVEPGCSNPMCEDPHNGPCYHCEKAMGA